MSTQAGEQTHLGVHNIARLRVAAGPAGQEADILEAGQPLGEDLADNLQELLAVVLDVLARLVGVGVGTGAADNLAGVLELLTIHGAEALVVATVDNHIQRAAVGSHHRQTARDESLVLHRVEAGVDTQHIGELLGAPAHGVDEMAAGVLYIFTLVVAHQGDHLVALAPHAQQLRVFIVASAEAYADTAYVVDHTSRRSLPAVARDEGVAVSVARVVPYRRYLLLEVLAVNHVGVAPGAAGVEGLVGGLVVHQVDIVRRLVVDVVHLLDTLEYLVAVLRDVGDVGVRECRTAATDVAPRGAAAPVHHHGLHARLAEVAEEAAARNAATGDENLHLFVLHVVALREDVDLLAALAIDVAQQHLVAQRRTRRSIAGELYAVGFQHATGTCYAALAAAGAHAHAGDVLQLVHRYVFAVAHHLEQLLVGDVLAVADIGDCLIV